MTVGVRLMWLVALVLGTAAVTGLTTQAMAATPQHIHARQHAHAHDVGSTPQSLAERQRLIMAGEASLAAGDIDGARHAFEQAANMAHSAEIELGILRTQMQAGEYRQALAFAAHTAGVHQDEVAGAAFYAWLLNLGAQVAVAEQTLEQAERRVPGHALLREVRQRMEGGAPPGPHAAYAGPVRLAPLPTGVAISPQARVVACAFLLADGRHALAPRVALPAAGTIWLRNGLGQVVLAQRAQHGNEVHDEAAQGDARGLVLLSLAQPLPVAGGEIVPPRDAFPGSPAFAVDYPVDATGQPAWPLMRAGFLGAPLPVGMTGTVWPMYRLGVVLPSAGSPRGGPVYDQGGRLVGLALGPAVGSQVDRLLPVSILRGHFGERFGVPMPEPRPSPVGADALYERAMKSTLQLIVATP